MTHTKACNACRCQLVACCCLWISAKNGYDGFREQGAASFDYFAVLRVVCCKCCLSFFFFSFFCDIEKFVAVIRRLSLQWEQPKFGNIVR